MDIARRTPKRLYRVQHDGSFTHYATNDGFVANGSYYMDYSHWVNPKKVTGHLDWSDRPLEPSPFISLFDNLNDAQVRALFHCGRLDTNVFIAEIDISRFVTFRLPIQFLNGLIELEGLIDPSTSTMVFPMTDLRDKFRINFRIVQPTEWLALSSIPPDLIRCVGAQDMILDFPSPPAS